MVQYSVCAIRHKRPSQLSQNAGKVVACSEARDSNQGFGVSGLVSVPRIFELGLALGKKKLRCRHAPDHSCVPTLAVAFGWKQLGFLQPSRPVDRRAIGC
jgi:hypothetical protein